MTLWQLKREIQSLKETVKDRPLKMLLCCKGEELTDTELARIIQEVLVRKLPTSILLEVLNRKDGTNYRVLQEIPKEHLEKMSSEYWENEPAAN